MEKRKEQILKTALDLFSRFGYAGTSVRQIARSIGVRESALYNHFKSKEEIFLALLAEFKFKPLGSIILTDELLDKISEPELFLKSFALKLIEHWNKPEERKFIRLLLMEQFTRIGNKELSTTEYLVELRSICKTIFTELIRSDIIENFDPALLAYQFTAPLFLIRTEMMSSENTGEIEKINSLVKKHTEFFWNTVKKKKQIQENRNASR